MDRAVFLNSLLEENMNGKKAPRNRLPIKRTCFLIFLMPLG